MSSAANIVANLPKDLELFVKAMYRKVELVHRHFLFSKAVPHHLVWKKTKKKSKKPNLVIIIIPVLAAQMGFHKGLYVV